MTMDVINSFSFFFYFNICRFVFFFFFWYKMCHLHLLDNKYTTLLRCYVLYNRKTSSYATGLVQEGKKKLLTVCYFFFFVILIFLIIFSYCFYFFVYSLFGNWIDSLLFVWELFLYSLCYVRDCVRKFSIVVSNFFCIYLLYIFCYIYWLIAYFILMIDEKQREKWEKYKFYLIIYELLFFFFFSFNIFFILTINLINIISITKNVPFQFHNSIIHIY